MRLTNQKDLNQRIWKFFDKKYDESYPKLKIIPILTDEEIGDNKHHVNRFTSKYPFYKSILEIIKLESNKELRKYKIISEVSNYLEVLFTNAEILVNANDYQISYKRGFSEERKRIVNDLNMMLYEAILNKKINEKLNIEKSSATERDSKAKKPINQKPGRKPFSVLDLIALKYQIIHKFYVNENPYISTHRFESIGAFYKEVAAVENINPDSFRNSYNKIKNEDLTRFCNTRQELVRQLQINNNLVEYPKCVEFIAQFNTN